MEHKEFDKIKEAENWLYNYKSIKAGIESLKEEYEALIKNADANNVTEKINIELNLIDSRIKSMKRKIEQIDRALNSLSNIERKIIECKCIDGMYYYEFTHEVYMGERQCIRIKKRALKKIAIALGL